MFLSNQNADTKELYFKLLQAVGALSRLSSESEVPFLFYRSAENIFCKAFNAENLSRSDCSVDARHGSIGIGLKTFLQGNGASFQKVAEFNKDKNLIEKYKNNPIKLVQTISDLRNKRLLFTENTYEINESIYHCVGRIKGKFCLFEEKMDKIDINCIKEIKIKDSGIEFSDGLHNYNFNYSKSTLFKKFITTESTAIDIQIFEDPFDYILKLLSEISNPNLSTSKYQETACFPLYSTTNNQKIVHKKSGLNQWNANGRIRNRYECYIPISGWFHKNFPDFFPKRDQKFNLILPNRKIISAKICQDGGKALMSDPNKELGMWLFDSVLKTKENELITYEMLQEFGIDSVEIRKIDLFNYEIDFKPTDSFEEFKTKTEKKANLTKFNL